MSPLPEALTRTRTLARAEGRSSPFPVQTGSDLSRASSLGASSVREFSLCNPAADINVC
jgi:hypothetical protein